MVDERRKRLRAPVQLNTEIRLEGDKRVQGQSKNISLKGMLCSGSELLKEGQNCLITIDLSTEFKVTIQGRIVRAGRNEAAIDFLSMDEDSFYHLKKIVEYNTDDPDKVTDELTKPVFGT